MSKHKIAMRIYRIRGEVMVAACDRELLGKKFEEGEFHIEVKKDFYYESYVSDKTFLNSMKIATIANLVGEHVIQLAIKEGYIDKDAILRIDGIPHAQMCLLF
ncbi:MAG: DUF424 domain-containing protein [Thermoplasmata archaeon]|nr:DUF424 domain-containing protein [Thermoplasmata archaeon]